MHHQDAIGRWIMNCEQSLQEAVEQLKTLDPTHTLCDFPLLTLTYSSLDTLLHQTLPRSGVMPQETEDVYPCSPMQRGLLLSEAKDARLYQTRFVWKVTPNSKADPVDVDRLRQAWQQVVDRHATLRTFFVHGESESEYFNQVVRRSSTANIEILECAGYGSIATLQKHPRPAYGVGQPPHRLLLCVTPTETYCALDMHHALMDAHSARIVQWDLRLAYDNQLPAMPAPPYYDYIAYIGGLSVADAETYWRSYMDGVQPCLFPTRETDDIRLRHDKELRSVCISLDAGARVLEFCQHHEVTLSNLFQVAWGLVLRSYTGSDTVCFGYLNSGRDVPVPRVHDTVGPFINMSVCRVEAEAESSVLSMLQKNYAEYLQSLPHQHYSLARILRGANVGGKPLFNTIMSLQRPRSNGRGSELDSSCNTITIETVGGEDPTEYEVAVTIGVDEQDIKISLSYWSTSIIDELASGVASTLQKIVLEIINRPHSPANGLDFVSGNDRRQIFEWNETMPARVERCVHALVEERCRVQPEAPAVCAWDGDLTYGELDALSSALAEHLAERGVGPEVFVPLCFEKSRWTTVAMLGVMKAGGAFVLLDPSHPRARLEAICRTVAAPLVVSSAANRALAAELAAAAVVVVGETETSWQEARGGWVGSLVTPDNALYAVFTSGTTGSPKGVVVPHASFSTAALAHAPALSIGPDTRVFQFSSYGFDNSVSDILTTLSAGGCVCVPSEIARQNQIAQAIKELRATLCFLTPSVARLCKPAELSAGLTIILMGEAPTANDVSVWAGSVRLFNEYGPAECSVITAVRYMTQKVTDARNIGFATGCVCWVVDPTDHERLLPIGAVGELLIEGPIVGRGYLNDPERTAAAFIEPPAWLRAFRATSPGNVGGDRLYKTGDLVQYAADGSLRFVGRKDTQVKLRGQRIELGEVEHHTRRSFPGARDVVAEVVTPAEVGRAPMLVAFVWVDSSSQSDNNEKDDILAAPTDDFRAAIPTTEAALHDAVPAYMVPALFLPLRGVPLSATGKTDRRRLRDRAAALSRADIEAYHGAPIAKRGPTTLAERTLQQLWARVLNLPPQDIGANDSFFLLGGDSISAMHLASLTRSQSFELSVSDIFELRQLNTLAAVLVKSENIEASTNVEPFSLLDGGQKSSLLRSWHGSPSLAHDTILDIMPVTDSQIFFLNQWSLSCFSFSIQGMVDLDRLRLACNIIVQTHSIMRTVFTRHQDKLLQVVLKSVKAPFHHIHTKESLEPLWRSICKVDSNEEVISGMPLVKFTLISRSETEHMFTIRLSHAQYDGSSQPFILRDLVAAYNEDVQSGPACANFPDYVYYCANNSFQPAFDFWKDCLQGSAMTMLPCSDLQLNQVPTDIHEIVSGDLPSALENFTIPTLINAAFSFVLASLTKKDDVVFGVVTNTRAIPLPHVQTILGPCINLNPFRARLAQTCTVKSLCRLLHDQYAQSLKYCYVNFSDICAKSTDWPSNTKFGCILNHLGVGEKSPLSLKDGGSISNSLAMSRIDLQDQVLIRSIPGNGQLQIQVLTSDRIMGSDQASMLAKRLIDTANAFARSPEALLHTMRFLHT
ncbi:unnamed protein product [Penicillium salamii]|nr:unnamed protein product [Penicillium salamii]CAG8278404.1 unnamed protein product [Penicillium salamii]